MRQCEVVLPYTQLCPKDKESVGIRVGMVAQAASVNSHTLLRTDNNDDGRQVFFIAPKYYIA